MAEPEHDDPDEGRDVGGDPDGDPRPRGLARLADIRFVEPGEHDRDEPTEAQRRHNGHVLTAVIALGGVVVVAIAVLAVIAVRHYLDETSSVRAQMSLKYHAQYRSCLERGGDRTRCATRAEVACAADSGWTADSRRVNDIADICLFGEDAYR